MPYQGYWLNKKFSEEHKQKISKAHRGRKHSERARRNISNGKMSEKNPMWKGDAVGYSALHDWVRRRIPNPGICSKCRKLSVWMELSNNGIYDRELKNWEWLCRKCHYHKDEIGKGWHSLCSRRKNAESRIGQRFSAERRKKISKAKIGVKLPPFSKQHKRKIGEAKKIYWVQWRQKNNKQSLT